MKKITIQWFGIFLIFLSACSGSDTYRGTWKAMDASGGKFEISFDAKTLTLKDSIGQSKTVNYTQNSVKIENSVQTYGIHLEDGRGYQIYFPKPDDESVGLIKDENGSPMFTISRNAYVKYEELYKL